MPVPGSLDDAHPVSTPEPTRFVAAVSTPDGGVSIGLTVQDDLVAGYVCGDDPETEWYPGWFTGEATDSSVALEKHDWIFTARWTADGAEGALIEPSGEEVRWAAPVAGGLSATYAARDAGCTTGVVVVDGPEPVLRCTWCNRQGEQRQATPLGPTELVDGRRGLKPWLLHKQGRYLLDPTLRVDVSCG